MHAGAVRARGDLSLAAMAHDLASVIDATAGAGRAVVVGHSMGGMTVLQMAESRPDNVTARLAGVVLTGRAAAGCFAVPWARSPISCCRGSARSGRRPGV